MDETVARLVCEQESFAALARLGDEVLQDYQDEQRELADADMTVPE